MNILFICTANICRSALAEVVLRKKLEERGLGGFVVESAGVRNLEGEPRDETLAAIARKAGYVLGGIAHYLDDAQLNAADLIICMEHYHVVEVQKRLPYARWDRIHRFNELCFGEPTNLIDPSGNTDYIYQCAFDSIEAGCEALISRLERMNNEDI